VNLLPLQEKLMKLEHEVYNQKRRIDFTAEDSVKWKDDAESTLQNMNILEKDVIQKIDLVNLIVSEVQSLALNIELGTSAKVDNALNEAKEILKKIKDVSFVEFRDNAVDQADQANILVSEMQEYNFPVNNLSSIAADLSNKIKNASAKMDDLLDIADLAQKLASAVDKLNQENRLAAQIGNLDVVKNSTAEAKEDLEAGEKLNNDANQFLNDAEANIDILR
jgi:laminin alpha 3/5